MNLSELDEAVDKAKVLQRLVEIQAKSLGELLRGNLRAVSRDGGWSSHELLSNLKRELSQYNAKTRKWKN